MELEISRPLGDTLPISVEMGEQLYLVGANGTGKSALFQHWLTSLGSSVVKRISAHRQTWLNSGNLEFTAHSRKQFEQNSRSWDREANARWMEHNPGERQSAVLFDLVAKDNFRNRTISQYIDDKDPEQATRVASKSPSPFQQLNELLDLGMLRVSLSNSNDEEILAKHRDGGQSYSIAKMSDGERAAAIMAANILVVEPETLLLIDEPERHLHRSIIEPFLSALFAQRQDCAFVISTHEIALPLANPTAHVVILRSCKWNGDTVNAWEIELLQSGLDLPEDLKRDILGARRTVLFVEGTPNSLDTPLYGVLFPMVSVIPKGSCKEVIRAVNGLRSSREHHHVEAFGLIDRDDRQPEEIERLAERNIFALDGCSVESLYYCSKAIETVAQRQAVSLGRNVDEMSEFVTHKALKAISEDEDLVKRMAARRSEGRLRSQIERLAPDWRTIMELEGHVQIDPVIECSYPSEILHFKKLVRARDLDGLVARYPLRQSNVFDIIAAALECKDKENYERMVVVQVRADENLADALKDRIGRLAELLDDGR